MTTRLSMVAIVALVATASLSQDVLVIRAGKVIPVVGAPISPGQILVRDGKVAELGAQVSSPEGARVFDVPDGVVIPGLVSAQSSLAESNRDTEKSVSPEIRMADAVDLFGDWRDQLSGGVTTVYFSPPGRRLIPGQGVVAKLGSAAPSARLLPATPALRVVLGEWPKNAPRLWNPPLPPTPDNPSTPPEDQLPTTRMGELKLLREVLTAARDADDTDDPATQTLKLGLGGAAVVRVKADRVEDIRNALAMADEFGLRLVIEGGREAHLVAGLLAQRGVPVVLGSIIRPGKSMGADLADTKVSGEVRPDAAAILAAAGVKVAIATDDASISELLPTAAWAVGNGMPPETALRAITADAASILGVEAHAGAIEAGRDADLVILTGEPFATHSVVLATVSDGRVAYERKVAAPAGDDSPLRVLRAREILTGVGGSITNGEVWIRNGLIERMGPIGATPPDAEVTDLGDRVLMPGMIDMQSRLGLHWESEEPTLGPQDAASGQGAGGPKHVSIADAIDPTDPAFNEALRAGVTSVVLAPADTGLYCGSAAVVKTAGDDLARRIVKPVAAFKFSLVTGQDRPGQVASVESFLANVEKYVAEWDEFENRWAEFERKYADDPTVDLKDLKEPARPRRDSELELLRGLIDDSLPVIVSAARADEITHAIEAFAGERGIDTMILGAADGWRIADRLRAAGVFAAAGPDLIQTERGREINLAGLLAEAGVPVTFQSVGTSGTQFLRASAAYAVRHGMGDVDALRALARHPAEFLRLEDRLGSLEPGCDADIVVLSGGPLEFTSRVEQVYVDGELAFDVAAQ